MATTTNLLSWEAFEKFPDDEMHHELIEGEHQILPPPKSGHSIIAHRAWKALGPLERFGTVLFEAGYKLSQDPGTWIQPDVSFLPSERIKSTPGDGYFLGALELAVEVVSPSETARQLERKVKLLLGSGAQAVWVIYPESHEVQVHTPGGTSAILSLGENLTLPGLLPDWQFPVARLFED